DTSAYHARGLTVGYAAVCPCTTLFRSERTAELDVAADRVRVVQADVRRTRGGADDSIGPDGAGHQIREARRVAGEDQVGLAALRSEDHTPELQSPYDLVCRLLLEKKKN